MKPLVRGLSLARNAPRSTLVIRKTALGSTGVSPRWNSFCTISSSTIAEKTKCSSLHHFQTLQFVFNRSLYSTRGPLFKQTENNQSIPNKSAQFSQKDQENDEEEVEEKEAAVPADKPQQNSEEDVKKLKEEKERKKQEQKQREKLKKDKRLQMLEKEKQRKQDDRPTKPQQVAQKKKKDFADSIDFSQDAELVDTALDEDKKK